MPLKVYFSTVSTISDGDFHILLPNGCCRSNSHTIFHAKESKKEGDGLPLRRHVLQIAQPSYSTFSRCKLNHGHTWLQENLGNGVLILDAIRKVTERKE